MSEVDEMKKVIADGKKRIDEIDKLLILAIETVDRTRKEKRAESNRPN